MSTESAHIDKFLQRLQKDGQTGINVAYPCRHLAMDIASSLAFGHSFNMQTDETNRIVSRTILLIQAKKSLRFARAVKAMVQTRMGQDKDAIHDFYSVANEVDAGTQFFSSEMWAEASGFLVAGGTTTASSICAILFYLSRYPDCYRTLAEEIRSTFSSSSEIMAGPQLNGCTYLRACIEEALRCASSALSPLWREQDPNDPGAFIVDGQVIPRGTEVAVPLYSLFHNEDVFDSPFTYRPERWLQPKGGFKSHEEKAAHDAMRKAFVPFLVGDRACAGKAMAWMELNLTIARIMWYFDFQKAPGEASNVGEQLHSEDGKLVPEYKVRDIFVAEHDGPNLVFSERENFAKELRLKD